MRLLAIDFGTSNTVAALLIDGQAPRTVTFDTSPLLPSAVFVGLDGQVTVGREAQRQARLDPSRYEPNPKRRIDDGEVLLGDRVVPVVDIIAAVLRSVATEVRRQLGGAGPDEVRLTHPAQWGAVRQNVLVSAARAAGLGNNILLIPEPVAAAAQFTRLPGRALPPGGTVAVYDLGGGTFDIAIVGRTQPSNSSSGPAREAEFHVLAEAGLADLGGLDFDQAILDQVGRATSATDPGRWQQVLRPVDPSGRRAARALAEDVRAAKETLSRYPQTDVSLPDPFEDAHLTRTEFEGLIRPNLLRSIEVLSGTLRNAGIAPERLAGIFLVGGSSRIPLVANLIQDRLHVTPVALDQPETAVALGALLVPVRRDGNRTVAMTDPPRPFAPSMSGSSMAGGPSLPTGPHSATPGPAATPPVTGPHRPTPGSAPSKSRRPLVLGAAVAVLVVLALVLIIAKPFSGSGTADPTTTPVSTRPTGNSTGPNTTGPNTSRPSTGGTSTGTTATTGLGPNKVFTTGEVGMLSNNLSTLQDCSDLTSAFNAAVTDQQLQVERAVRCTVPEADAKAATIFSRMFVYIMTTRNGAAGAVSYIDRVYSTRQHDKNEGWKQDADTPISAASTTGRLVVAYDQPAFGPSSYDATQGGSVLAWQFAGQPYVGVVVTPTPSSQSDLTTFWTQNYKPRG